MGPLETRVVQTIEAAVEQPGGFKEKVDPIASYGAGKARPWERYALRMCATNSLLLRDLARRLDELDTKH